VGYYLVTGGAGFIGSHLVEALVQAGRPVRVLDNFATGQRQNLAPWLSQIELVEGDIRRLAQVRAAMAGVEVALHLAALPSVAASIDDPVTCHKVNVNGTLNMLLAAREAGVKRVVFASSCAVYGDSQVLPNHEALPTAPLSPYAASKAAGESYGLAFSRVYNLPFIALRFFNVFGPRQDPTSDYSAVIPKFITRMQAGEAPTIYGDGWQSRDFVYIGNIVAANLLAAAAPSHISGCFNVAAGQSYNLLDLVEALNEVLQTNIRPLFAPPRPGDIKHSSASIERIEQALGYRPVVNFREGLKLTAASFHP
jgi:UDP-glucose 4-epimerase